MPVWRSRALTLALCRPYQGPRGELSRTLHPLVTVRQDNSALVVERANETRQANAIHGLERSLVSNMVTGVSAGFTRTLQMVGVGYRAAVQGRCEAATPGGDGRACW